MHKIQNMKKTFLVLGLLLVSFVLKAQNLKGNVWGYDENGQTIPLYGVVIHWQNSSVGAVTDSAGFFSIPKIGATDTLLVLYPAYANDTLIIPQNQYEIQITLTNAHLLEGVNVTADNTSYISIQPILTNVITSEGLRKAACCNLSESFESTAAVDVEYSDAVSGAKQISMLGLAGIYTQILLENVPYIRLLSHQFGMAFVPGTWMESISVSKGVASVTNGYEAISGQIDVEFKKPETNYERLFINLYGNLMGKGELNLNSRLPVGKKENASTMFLLHGEGQFAKIDHNHDHFLDVPQNFQIDFMNRWDYRIPGRFSGRTLLGYAWETRTGGDKRFTEKAQMAEDSIYGMHVETHKLDFITKNGFLLQGEEESIGTILAFTFHDNASFFGFTDYMARQISGYANVLYSNKFGQNKRHKLTAGGSFQFDNLTEELSSVRHVWLATERHEAVPGIFAEYAYIIDDKLVVMPGMRLDYDFAYREFFWTPRLHIKWQIVANSTLRLSAGKGYRTSNIIPENFSLLISNRKFDFIETLKAEEAYNAGISFIQYFMMKGGKSSFSIDYYYTHFINQVIVDLEQNAHRVCLYNLNGDFNGSGNRSFSHAVQAELTLYPLERFEIIVAYRYNDVRQTMQGKLLSKALSSPHKALLSLNYATRFNKWKFSTTLQYNSSMRLPDMSGNLSARLPGHSPDYFIWNAQITKKYKGWEWYVGGENLLNYKQKNPIIAADNPFGDDFDASLIYAPITGIMGYIGMRFVLK